MSPNHELRRRLLESQPQGDRTLEQPVFRCVNCKKTVHRNSLAQVPAEPGTPGFITGEAVSVTRCLGRSALCHYSGDSKEDGFRASAVFGCLSNTTAPARTPNASEPDCDCHNQTPEDEKENIKLIPPCMSLHERFPLISPCLQRFYYLLKSPNYSLFLLKRRVWSCMKI